MSDPTINTKDLRKLLAEAYTNKELRYFIFDHFNELDSKLTPGMSVDDLVDALIKHVNGRNQFEELVKKVKDDRPEKFEEYQAKILITERTRRRGGDSAAVWDRSSSPESKGMPEILVDRMVLMRTRASTITTYVNYLSTAEGILQQFRDLIKNLDENIEITHSPAWNKTLAKLLIMNLDLNYRQLQRGLAEHLWEIHRLRDPHPDQINDREKLVSITADLETALVSINGTISNLGSKQKQTEDPDLDLEKIGQLLEECKNDIDCLAEETKEMKEVADEIRNYLLGGLKLWAEDLSRIVLSM